MVGYFEDGPSLVTMAMNGWGEGEPAWWLNLQSHPDAGASTLSMGRVLSPAELHSGEERERLWARWRAIDKNLDAYAARHPLHPDRSRDPRAAATTRRGRARD